MSVRTVAVRYMGDPSQLIAANRAAATSTARVGTAARAAQGQVAGMGAASRTAAGGVGLMSAKFLGPAGLLLGLQQVGSAGMEFERSLTKMETLVGLASDEVDTLSAGVLGLSDVTQGPQDLADAMFFVTSAGLRGADALDTVEAAAKAADIGLGDVATVADLATSAMNAYGIENLNASDATDILAGAVRAGKLESEEMAGAMGRLLPTASAMNVSFEDLAGTMAVMSRTGSNANESVTSIQAILSTMLKPTKEAQDALAEVGVSMRDVRDVAEGPDGLVGAMRFLNDAFDGNDEALAQVIPNVRAFRGAMNVLAQDSTIVDDVLGDVSNSIGLVGEAHDKHMQTAGAQWDLLKRNIEAAKVEAGGFQGALAAILQDINREMGDSDEFSFTRGVKDLAQFLTGNGHEVLLGMRNDVEEVDLALTDAEQSLRAHIAAANDAANATDDLAGSTGGFTGSLADLRVEAWQTADGLFDLSAALNDLIGVHTSAERAVINLEQGWDDLTEALNEGNTSLDQSTEKGRDNWNALLDQTDAVLGVMQAEYDRTGSLSAVLSLYDDHVGQLKEVMRQAGFTEAQIDEYLETLGMTPEEVLTVIAAQDDASGIIEGIIARLGRIPTVTRTRIITTEERNVLRTETGVHLDGNGNVIPRSHSGSVIGSGQAGLLGGLGSDERMRVLQVGQEVLTADDPRHINNLGGLSGQQLTPAPAGGGGGGPVHVHTTVELDGYQVGSAHSVQQGMRDYGTDRSRDTAGVG